MRLPKKYKYPTFSQRMAIKYKDWSNRIREDFNKFGIKNNIIISERKYHTLKNRKYDSVDTIFLYTVTYPQFSEFRDRWYDINGKKRIPIDLDISSELLANWYMGDGSLSILRKKYKNKEYKYWQITLCVNSFIEKDVDYIVDKLKKNNFNFTKSNGRDGFRIHLSKQEDVFKFLRYTLSHKVKCFDYKWRAILEHNS
jgi:hypothetical protein